MGSVNSNGGDPVEFILSRIGKKKRAGRGWTGLCPAHDDKEFSLSIGRGAEGKVLLKCHAGCSVAAICEALGIDLSDLFSDSATGSRSRRGDWAITATYDYHDQSGQLLCQHVRYRNKQFHWRAPDGQGGWRYGLYGAWFEQWNDEHWRAARNKEKNLFEDPQKPPHTKARWFDAITARALYKESLIREAAPGEIVFYVEGEKDQQTAERLDLVATTAGSASDWRPEFAPLFEGLHLVILPDNDLAGERLAQKVAADCYELAASIRVLRLPELPEHGDLSDWVEAQRAEGASFAEARDRLLELASDAETWEPHLDRDEFTERAIAEAHRAILRASTEMKQEHSDPALTDEKSKDKQLRSINRDAARVVDLIMLLMAALGFEGNHYRLINALIALAKKLPNPLVYFTATHAHIYSRYRRTKTVKERSQTALVGADVLKLRDEMAALGYQVVDYIKGGMSGFGTTQQHGYGSRFRLQIVRYALIAMNLSDRVRDSFAHRWQADEWAVQQVAALIPQAEQVEQVSSSKRAEARASDRPGFDKLKSEFLRAAAAEFERIVDLEIARASSVESLGEKVDELASELTSRINIIASKALCRGVSELAENEPKSLVHETMEEGTLFDGSEPPDYEGYNAADDGVSDTADLDSSLVHENLNIEAPAERPPGGDDARCILRNSHVRTSMPPDLSVGAVEDFQPEEMEGF